MRRSALLLLAASLSACAAARAPKLTAAAPPIAAAAPEPAPASPSRKQVIQRVLPSTVRVFLMEDGKVRKSGTGVVIGTETTSHGSASYILTNAHVIDDRKLTRPSVTVVVDRGPESLEYDAGFVAAGDVAKSDLALLRLPGVMLPAAELAADEELVTGEDVLVVAAPLGGTALTVAGGMLSQVQYDRSDQSVRSVKTDAAVSYGSSGGGIYSLSTGRLLAIVEGYRTTKLGFAIAQQAYSFDLPLPGETFAVPTGKVRAFLADKGFGHLVGAPAKLTSAR